MPSLASHINNWYYSGVNESWLFFFFNKNVYIVLKIINNVLFLVHYYKFPNLISNQNQNVNPIFCLMDQVFN